MRTGRELCLKMCGKIYVAGTFSLRAWCTVSKMYFTAQRSGVVQGEYQDSLLQNAQELSPEV